MARGEETSDEIYDSLVRRTLIAAQHYEKDPENYAMFMESGIAFAGKDVVRYADLIDPDYLDSIAV